MTSRPILTLKTTEKKPVLEKIKALEMFTVYGPNQIEHPGRYVVRRWTAYGGDPVPDKVPYCVGDSLHAARLGLPFGLARIRRADNDDPSIVETWL